MKASQVVVGTGKRIHLGISTCPNDTFAFAGLLDGLVSTEAFEFVVDLLDIDELNRSLLGGQYDVLKASYHAALLLADQITVLPVGSALGFGVGPLLLAAREGEVPGQPKHSQPKPGQPKPGQPKPGQQTRPTETRRPTKTRQANRNTVTSQLCPGEHTTAKLLFDLFYGQTTRVEHVVFSEIMPRLMRQTADFGVCIHEGRFTYQASGLHCVEDLGQRWETETNCPLPLGGLFMRDTHDEDVMREVSAIISKSLGLARSDPAIALPCMRKYAQSMNDEVLMQHVDLYVNDWTVDLRKRATVPQADDLPEKGAGVEKVTREGLRSLNEIVRNGNKRLGKMKVHSQGLRVLEVVVTNFAGKIGCGPPSR